MGIKISPFKNRHIRYIKMKVVEQNYTTILEAP